MKSASHDTAARLGYLDTLRGFAILAVIVFHVYLQFRPGAEFDRLFSLGVYGVQLFFLVSSITMCHMWITRENEVGRTWKFYFRRFMRIAPLYWLALFIYPSLFGFGVHAQQPLDPGAVWLSASFLNAAVPDIINKLVPGGWSISIEVMFYFLFPALITFLSTSRSIRWTALGAFILCVAAMEILTRKFGGFWNGGIWEEFLYYSLLTQLPVFLIGMAIYPSAIMKERIDRVGMTLIVILWLGIAVIAKHYGLHGRPGFWLSVFILAGFVILICRRRWTLPFVEVLGRRSYSMYLVHFAIILLLKNSNLLNQPFLNGWSGYFVALALTLLLTLLVSTATYRYMEVPLGRLTKELIERLGQLNVALKRT